MDRVKQNLIVLIGCGVGLAFWFLEAAIHTHIFDPDLYIQHLIHPDAHEVWMRIIVIDLFIAFGAVAQILFNRQKRAEEATKFAYNELNQIFQTAADGMRVVDTDFKMLRINETFANLSGVSEDEGVGRKCYEVLRGPLCHTSECPLIRALNGEEYIECEVEKESSQGFKIPCILTATPFRGPDGSLLGIVEDFKDISERKMVEKALRASERELRWLSSQLLSAQESERKRLSVELHDDLGQALTVLKLKLRASIEAFESNGKPPKEECESILADIDGIINDVRRISKDLSPPVLEDLGLAAALRRLIENNSQHFSIEVSLDLPDGKEWISPESQIILYRIIQEGLTNIGRHAQASRVAIFANLTDGHIYFHLEDNGRGFNVSRVIAREPGERGMGLPAMHERVRILGGSLDIHSQEGVGTKITLKIPLVKVGNSV